MIGLVIVGHGNLAQNMVSVVTHVLGTQEQMATVAIESDQDKEVSIISIREAVDSVDTGSGTIIVTDLCGSTPTNWAIEAANDYNAAVLSGANIPMLIKLATIRHEEDIDSAVHIAIAAGGQYIRIESF